MINNNFLQVPYIYISVVSSHWSHLCETFPKSKLQHKLFYGELKIIFDLNYKVHPNLELRRSWV